MECPSQRAAVLAPCQDVDLVIQRRSRVVEILRKLSATKIRLRQGGRLQLCATAQSVCIRDRRISCEGPATGCPQKFLRGVARQRPAF